MGSWAAGWGCGRGPLRLRPLTDTPCSLADGDPEQIDFIDSHVPGEDEERGTSEVRGCRIPCPPTVREPAGASQGRLGTPSAPLLSCLQEPRPPESESSPAAGDAERAPRSRYPEPPRWRPSRHTRLRSPGQQCLCPSALRREEPAGEERRRPDTLQLWQERERRQQQSALWGAPRKDR